MEKALVRAFNPKLPLDGKRPNFFLAGAARSGTHTLYYMLRQHPDIYMPAMKEPSFFCSYYRVVQEASVYCAQFAASKQEKALGEASHIYLSNPETPEMLHDQFPNAKFILILRNPTNRAYSLYHWMRRAGFEKLDTFEKAIAVEASRYEDPDFFGTCPQYFWNYLYTMSSYYNIQLERYFKVFSRNQFFILSLEELARDPFGWGHRIFEFLEVDPEFKPGFSHAGPGVYPPLNPDTRAWLDAHFEGVVTETNKLVGRDLQLSMR